MTAGRPNNIRAAALRRAMTDIMNMAHGNGSVSNYADISQKASNALATDDRHTTDEARLNAVDLTDRVAALERECAALRRMGNIHHQRLTVLEPVKV